MRRALKKAADARVRATQSRVFVENTGANSARYAPHDDSATSPRRLNARPAIGSNVLFTLDDAPQPRRARRHVAVAEAKDEPAVVDVELPRDGVRRTSRWSASTPWAACRRRAPPSRARTPSAFVRRGRDRATRRTGRRAARSAVCRPGCACSGVARIGGTRGACRATAWRMPIAAPTPVGSSAAPTTRRRRSESRRTDTSRESPGVRRRVAGCRSPRRR